jgi:hypothetical protein
MTRRFIGSIFLLSLTCALGCRGPRYVTGETTGGGEVVTFAPPTTTLVVRPTQAIGDVEAALLRAAEARRYVVEGLEPGRLSLRLESRGTVLHIVVAYDGEHVAIDYASSTGLPLEDVGESRRYEALLRNLAESIEGELARPAREAAEAIARTEAIRVEEAERERRARLESERLAAERARAEADTARERRIEAEVRAVAPRLEGPSVYVSVPGFAFDAAIAEREPGALRVAPGFGDERRRGMAGGPARAESLGLPGGCPGWFPTAPQHTIILRGDVPHVRIEAPSAGDATLAIVAPDGGVWCNDDGAGGLSPRIEGWLPAGAYHVFVGNYRGPDPLPYTLTISNGVGPTGPMMTIVPECRRTLLEMGHPPDTLMFCEGAEPRCADALLRARHDPSALVFCRDVAPDCAEALLRHGGDPSELIQCS